MVLELIIAYTFLASIAGLLGGLLLIYNEHFTKKASIYLVSFAAGALLAAAFLDLIPEGLELIKDVQFAFILVLAGILSLFIIEKMLLWTHCHNTEKCEAHHEAKPYIITIGDTIHNTIDGAIVGASFIASVPLGILTAIAVFFHEIPQEIGDFGTMLYMGWSRKKVILFNLISASFAFLGAILAYFFTQTISGLLGIIIMFAAGHFVYISIADLIPELHKEMNIKKATIQILIMILGIALMFGLKAVLE